MSRSTRTSRAVAALIIVALPIGALSVQAQSPQPDACIRDFDPAVDYYPDKTTLTDAINFSVTYHRSYKIVTVDLPFVGGSPQTYVLVRCGAPIPELTGALADAVVVETPVPSIFSASTTHNPMFDALGVVDRVTGVSTLAFTANEAILEAGANGQPIEFATTGTIDIELVIDAAPAMFMTGGSDNQAYDLLREAGISIIANAEWLEPSILGRAEWIKYVALFFDREALADEAFQSIVTSYLTAADTMSGIAPEDRPLVLAGSSFRGVFYASGGKSYVAQTIAAAGARYVFDDNDQTASLALPDLELVLDTAANADFWINSAIEYQTLGDIEMTEPRLAALPAAQSGQVWNYDRIKTESGGVAFFELGVLRPDLVLRDLIEIFHPGTLPNHEFTFYRQVSAD